jgi:heat shock protein HslJ
MKTVKITFGLFSAFIFGTLYAAQNNSAEDFNLVQEKNWQLIHVGDSNGNEIFDRAGFNIEEFDDVYTIRFNAARAFGKAFPNRYNFPYSTSGENIFFKPAISTKMYAPADAGGFSEDEFYKLLENAKTWYLSEGSFTINSVNFAGVNVTLYFIETQ